LESITWTVLGAALHSEEEYAIPTFRTKAAAPMIAIKTQSMSISKAKCAVQSDASINISPWMRIETYKSSVLIHYYLNTKGFLLFNSIKVDQRTFDHQVSIGKNAMCLQQKALLPRR
jgi:hypothetical protein